MAKKEKGKGPGDIEKVDIEPLSDEDLESVAGGAEADSINVTSCCSVNATACCSDDKTACCDAQVQ